MTKTLKAAPTALWVRNCGLWMLILLVMISSMREVEAEDVYYSPTGEGDGSNVANCREQTSPCLFGTTTSSRLIKFGSTPTTMHLLAGIYNTAMNEHNVTGDYLDIVVHEGALFEDFAVRFSGETYAIPLISTKKLGLRNSTLDVRGNTTIKMESQISIILENVVAHVSSSSDSFMEIKFLQSISSLVVRNVSIERSEGEEEEAKMNAFKISAPLMDNLILDRSKLNGFSTAIKANITGKGLTWMNVTNTEISLRGKGAIFSVPEETQNTTFPIVTWLNMVNSTFTGGYKKEEDGGRTNMMVRVFLGATIRSNSISTDMTIIPTYSLTVIVVELNVLRSGMKLSLSSYAFIQMISNYISNASIEVKESYLFWSIENRFEGGEVEVMSRLIYMENVKSKMTKWTLSTDRVSLFGDIAMAIVVQYSTFLTDDDLIWMESRDIWLWKTDVVGCGVEGECERRVKRSLSLSSSSPFKPIPPLTTQYRSYIHGDFRADGIVLDMKEGERPSAWVNFGRISLMRSFSSSPSFSSSSPIFFINAGTLEFWQDSIDASPVIVSGIDIRSFRLPISFISPVIYNPLFPAAFFSDIPLSIDIHSLFVTIDGASAEEGMFSSSSPPFPIFSGLLNHTLDGSFLFERVIESNSSMGFEGIVVYDGEWAGMNFSSPLLPSSPSPSSPFSSIFYNITRSFCPSSCNGHGTCVGVSKCACFAGFSGKDCSCSSLPPGASCAHNDPLRRWFFTGGVDISQRFPAGTNVAMTGDFVVSNINSISLNNSRYDIKGDLLLRGLLEIHTRLERSQNATTSTANGQDSCFFRTSTRSSASSLAFGPQGVVNVNLDLGGAELAECFLANSSLGARSERNEDSFLPYLFSSSSPSPPGADFFDITRSTKASSLFELDSTSSIDGNTNNGKINIFLSGPAPKKPITIALVSLRNKGLEDVGSSKRYSSSTRDTVISTGLSIPVDIQVSSSPGTCSRTSTYAGITSLIVSPCGDDNSPSGKQNKKSKSIPWYAYGIPIIIIAVILIFIIILVLTVPSVRYFIRPYSAASKRRAGAAVM